MSKRNSKGELCRTHILVIDVESVGLHGEGFAVAGVLMKLDGTKEMEFCYHVPLDSLQSTNIEALQWCRDNITLPESSIQCSSLLDLRNQFWQIWKEWRGCSYLAADCLWPVEANFLEACVNDLFQIREWKGPYPFIDIASFSMCVGLNPLGKYNRREDELPEHNPLCDARQSARMMSKVISAYNFNEGFPWDK